MAPPAMNGTSREICNVVPELPECCTLNQDGERGDERRALGGRNNVKPNGRGDQPKREPGDAGHDGTEEGGNEEEREVHWDRQRSC